MNANLLKGKLRERGMTQAQAAKIVGVSPSNFNDKINGTGGADFRLGEARKLIRALNLTPDAIDKIFLG